MDFRLQKTIFLTLVLALVLGACTTQPIGPAADDNDNMLEEGAMMEDNDMAEDNIGDQDVMMEENIVTFKLTGGNYYFEMEGEKAPTLRVQAGDTVRIELTAVEGFHDWVLDEFNAATEKVRTEDGMTYVEFVADTPGEYEYYCSVGSHRENGMFGTFIVE